MASYQIAIPSYRRANEIRKTLSTIARYGLDNNNVHIFVIPEEFDAYWEEWGSNYQPCPKILRGVRGLAAQRRFICDHFPLGTRILFLDDDIDDFLQLDESGSVQETIERLFDLLESSNLSLGGFYPVSNKFFMKPRVIKGSAYVVGAAFCLINKRQLSAPIDEKEDYYNSCDAIRREGAILRCEYIGIRTNYMRNKGGLQELRTDDSVKYGAFEIYYQFMDLLNAPKIKGAKKYWDVSFKRSPKTIVYQYQVAEVPNDPMESHN